MPQFYPSTSWMHNSFFMQDRCVDEAMVPPEIQDLVLNENKQMPGVDAKKPPTQQLHELDLLCEGPSTLLSSPEMICNWLMSSEQQCNSPQLTSRAVQANGGLKQEVCYDQLASRNQPCLGDIANTHTTEPLFDSCPLGKLKDNSHLQYFLKPDAGGGSYESVLPDSPPAQQIPSFIDSPPTSHVPPVHPSASTSFTTASPTCRKVLKSKIQRSRPGLKPEYSTVEPEKLSDEDLKRRNIRRERNKKAALKCREKKKREQDEVIQHVNNVQRENVALKLRLRQLLQENEQLRIKYEKHVASRSQTSLDEPQKD